MVNLRTGSDDEFTEERDRDIDSDEEEEDIEIDETGLDDLRYQPPAMLKQHTWRLRRISDLVVMMEGPDLILDPAYQRNVVWQKERMTRLINSLMANYYVPPLIFNVKKIPSGDGDKQKQQRICIDGKQRLSSIKAFVAGEIPCHDHKKVRWWYCNPDGGRRKNLLDQTSKNQFNSLELLVVEYEDLELTQEEELFARVQMGLELRPAEKLKAKSGPWQTFGAEIENAYPDLCALIDNKRARAFQTILSCFKTLLSDDDIPAYSPGISSLTPFLEKTYLLDETFKNTASNVFNRFNEVHKAYPHIFENNNYKHSANFAPIEFVGVALLIDRHRDRSVGLLAGDIKHMREVLRSERQELRSNSTTFKTVAQYINNLQAYRGGQGVIVRPEDQENYMEEAQERKPKIVNGTAVASTPTSIRAKGKAAPTSSATNPKIPPSKRAVPESSRPPTPAQPPAGPKSSAQAQQTSGTSTPTSTAPQKPFNPPKGPIVFRERQKQIERQKELERQKREPPAMAPVAPMTRNDQQHNQGVKLRPTTFNPSIPTGPAATRNLPTSTGSFRAINTPKRPAPQKDPRSSSFLPNLDSPPVTPSSSSLATRKRQRREEEELDDDEFDLEGINRRNTLPPKRTQIDDDVDLIEMSFRRLPHARPLGGFNGGGSTGGRRASQGRGGGNFGQDRRVKQERGSNNKYGPFTVDDY